MRKKSIFVVLVSLFVVVGMTGVVAEEKPAYSTGTISTLAKKPPLPSVTQELDTLFLWDFEDGDGGFIAKNLGDVGAKWHTTDEYWTLDGSKAWWCGEARDSAWGYADVWGYSDMWSQTLDMEASVDLSGTSNPVLSFDTRFYCEGSDFDTFVDCLDTTDVGPPYDSIGVSPDWDGLVVYVSTDGGATFPPENFLLPTDLTHVCVCGTLWSHQTAAGYFVEGGIEGINGNSQGWLHLEYPLDDYKTNNVVVRLHFCADQCLSSIADNLCGTTAQDTALHGFFLDNISVDDGGTNLFFDNADDEVHMVPGVTFRNNIWQYVDGVVDAPSPTHAWVGDGDDEWDLRSVWLETDWLDFPEGWYPELRYWFKCDMPDFDGNHDTGLEDYFEVDVSEDGVAWTKLFHHWAREPEGFSDTTGYVQTCHFETWWGYVYDDLMYNGHMTLWDYGGKTVKLRWMTGSDANDDCGNGTGLWLDNIEIVAREAPPFDMGVERIDYSTPNAVESPTEVTLTIRNFGLNKAYGYFFYEIWDDQDNRVLPPTPGVADSFEIGDIREISFDWIPSDPGVYRVLGFRFIGEDYYGPNDSTFSPWINVFPANEGAMFDHHFLTGNISRFGEDNGVAVHLFPPEWLGTFRITEGAVQYTSGEGPYTVHIFTVPSIPDFFTPDTVDTFYWDDTEILASVSTHTNESKLPDWPIPDVPPGFDRWGQDWYGVDLSGEDSLKCMDGDFFLFIQHGGGHTGYIPLYADPDPPSGCFTYNSDSLRFIRSSSDYVLRIGISWPGECAAGCVGTRGDANEDGTINVLDVLRIVNHILGIDPLTGDGLCTGDCNADGTINVLDALGVVNDILGIAPCAPVGAKAVLGTPQAIMSAEAVSFERNLEVPISLSSEISVAGAQFTLRYDAAKVVPDQVALSARWEGMEVASHTEPGELRVVVYSLNGRTVDAGQGEVATVCFRVVESGDPELAFGDVILAHSCTEAIFPEVRPIGVKAGVVPTEYSLAQNYPNPFNPTTSIQYSVASDQSPPHVTLKIYNLLGQEVVTLVDEAKEPGFYTVSWDASDWASGVYFYRLVAGEYSATRRMVLLK